MTVVQSALVVFGLSPRMIGGENQGFGGNLKQSVGTSKTKPVSGTKSARPREESSPLPSIHLLYHLNIM